MSMNAFKRLGLDVIDQNPTLGVIEPISKCSFPTIKSRLLHILSEFSTTSFWTAGSAGTWDKAHPCYDRGSAVSQANDIDVWLDTGDVASQLLLRSPDVTEVTQSVAEILATFYTVCRTGNIVHLALPANYDVYSFTLGKNLHAFYQVDLIFSSNAKETVKHHEHDLSARVYPGYQKIAAISSLVNSVPNFPERTFQYSAFTGTVKNRNTQTVVATTLDELAKLALGKKYSASDLYNLDNIVRIVGINSNRLEQYRSEFTTNDK